MSSIANPSMQTTAVSKVMNTHAKGNGKCVDLSHRARHNDSCPSMHACKMPFGSGVT